MWSEFTKILAVDDDDDDGQNIKRIKAIKIIGHFIEHTFSSTNQ